MTDNRTKKDNSKKKIAIILIGLLFVVAILIGSLSAFFSDVAAGVKPISKGTLALTHNATFYINGSDIPASDEELSYIRPGDYIKAVIDIENEGSKSAWLQSSIKLSGTDSNSGNLTETHISDVFTVYEGTDTNAEPLNGTGADCVIFTDHGKNVIDGTYDKETGTPPSDVNFIKNTTTNYIFTIVFDEKADNFWQNANIAIDYEVRALQYRNNAEPFWGDAVANIYK